MGSHVTSFEPMGELETCWRHYNVIPAFFNLVCDVLGEDEIPHEAAHVAVVTLRHLQHITGLYYDSWHCAQSRNKNSQYVYIKKLHFTFCAHKTYTHSHGLRLCHLNLNAIHWKKKNYCCINVHKGGFQ